jgi:hypothetical protein
MLGVGIAMIGSVATACAEGVRESEVLVPAAEGERLELDSDTEEPFRLMFAKAAFKLPDCEGPGLAIGCSTLVDK